MKALIILSGGIDSTTLLYELVRKYAPKEILALSFDYGSKHNQFELQKAIITCKKLRVKQKIINIEEIFNHFDSNLLKNGGKIPKGSYKKESMKKTVVPFRNGILLSIAIGLAESLKIKSVYYGAHGGDHSIYPDCTADFLNGMIFASQNGTYNKVKIIAPYLKFEKKHIIQQGLKLGVNYKQTHSCYDPDEFGRGCGKCSTCLERLSAFSFNNTEDPILYQL